MTAREELFRRVAGAYVSEERANALIDAYRAEVLREAADAIDPGPQECPPGCVTDCADCTSLANARLLRSLAARALAAVPGTEDGAR